MIARERVGKLLSNRDDTGADKLLQNDNFK